MLPPYSCRVPNVSKHKLNSKSMGFQLPKTPWVMQSQGWVMLPDGMANWLRVPQFVPWWEVPCSYLSYPWLVEVSCCPWFELIPLIAVSVKMVMKKQAWFLPKMLFSQSLLVGFPPPFPAATHRGFLGMHGNEAGLAELPHSLAS